MASLFFTFFMFRSFFVILIALACITAVALAADPVCPKTAAPSWVIDYPVPAGVKEPADKISNGSWLLLVDEQRHAGKETFYGHYARKFISSTGVQDYSRINLGFDPSYQTIALHTLKIHRGGETLNRLAAQPVQLLQREEQMEQHLYDGRQTVVLVLDDIRVGDVIEYAFSLKGANPIFAGRYSDSFAAQFSTPLYQLRERLLWPRTRKLQMRNHQTEIAHSQTETKEFIDHRWSADDLPALVYESGTPSWFSNESWIQFSEYQSWGAVVDWAIPQYTASARLPASLSPLMERLRAKPEGEAQILTALEYAQDEVRYLAMAIGAHSHQPYPVETVLTRGFGDCKDKARLLCAILNELGYTAHPALVETRLRQSIADWLPTPTAFNHVVVHLEWKGKTYWLDPTSSFQRGPLDTRFFPAYGKALVIKAGMTELTDIARSGFDTGSKVVRENYDITGFRQPVSFVVESVFRGREADSMRSFVADSNPEQIRKLYSNYYARLFPSIEMADAPGFSDDASANQLTSSEKYTIKALWEPIAGNETQLFAEFYASTIADYVAAPDMPLRTKPLGVSYPRQIEQTITVKFPDDSTFTARSTRVDDPAFQFEFAISQAGRVLTLHYVYKSLSDHVPAGDIAVYLAHLKEARDTLSYTVHIPKELKVAAPSMPPESQEKPLLDDFNWLFLAVALMTVVSSIVGAILLYRWRPEWPPKPAHANLNGIGGWLILIAFNVSVQPFVQLFTLGPLWNMCRLSTWNVLTTSEGARYHALWAPGLLYSVVFGIAAFVFEVLLVVLFFKKRRIFPRLMIVLIVAIVTGAILDLVFMSSIASKYPDMADSTLTTDLVKAVFRAAIWIPYFSISKRVQTTFTR
ncbi:MAG: hypothetical protein JWL59_1865 [Chthoniobacteraceae bacterium]|nr:hypothetical protein [Chthoniobacteraceae bacterium]